MTDVTILNSAQTDQRVQGYALLVFLLAASFYLFEFALQVSPSVMTDHMMADMQIASVGLGLMASAYFYAYAPMQLPAGLLYDRFGPRLLLTLSTLICAAGAFIFAMTLSVYVAAIGRVMMGIGSAFAFIGVLVLVSRWFPARYFALMAGIAQMMGSVGAIGGKMPLSAMVSQFGWRGAVCLMGVIGIVLAYIIWKVVRDAPDSFVIDTNKQSSVSELTRLKSVAARGQTWAIALYGFCIWAPILVMAGLWGIPYLKTLYQIDAYQASQACAMIWIGIGVGSPLLGWLSDYVGKRCWPLALAALLGLISTAAFVFMPNISWWTMCLLLFFLGIGAGGQSLSFGVIQDINRSDQVGTACGFNNMAVVAGGALFQPLVGLILNQYWDFTVVNGVPEYSIVAYEKAFILFPICYLIAFIISVCGIRETNAQSQSDD